MQRRNFIKLLGIVAVGTSLDAEMGAVVLFGTGGVHIKPMKDVALVGARAMRPRPRELIRRTVAGVKLKENAVVDGLIVLNGAER